MELNHYRVFIGVCIFGFTTWLLSGFVDLIPAFLGGIGITIFAYKLTNIRDKRLVYKK